MDYKKEITLDLIHDLQRIVGFDAVTEVEEYLKKEVSEEAYQYFVEKYNEYSNTKYWETKGR